VGRGIIYVAGANHVRPIIRIIARALFRAGGLGVLTLGAFDSSPLVVPFGNDLLVLALCARYHDRMPYYAVMATLGSLIGCFATVWVSRKGSSHLNKIASRKYLGSIQDLVQKRAGWTLVVASMLPPPFPFTAIVAAAAAFKYPGKKLFSFVGAGRFARFLIEGALAIHYGRWIIRQARSPILEDVMIALIVISLGASMFSIYQWNEKSKRPTQQSA
jgi:membrane protein YqaA with SNARE-associated domain